MRLGKRVIYVGPEAVFHGLKGRLVEVEDAGTRRVRLHFQPECEGILAVPCGPEDVCALESAVAQLGLSPLAE
jgi:hypothetical protein